MKPLRPRSWIVGGAGAVVLGFAVAAYFSIVDWRFNPGDIFHDDSGTRWAVVLETFVSWFLPVALIAFVPVTALHYWLAPRDSHE